MDTHTNMNTLVSSMLKKGSSYIPQIVLKKYDEESLVENSPKPDMI